MFRRVPGWRRLVLKRASRLASDDADATLTRWVAHDPDHFELRIRHAFSAHHAGRYAEAMARWDAIRERWPDAAVAWTGGACNRRELGRSDEALAVITEALHRVPDDVVTKTEAIRIRDWFRDDEAIIALTRDLVRCDPQQAQWRKDHVERLLAADRIDEAIACLGEAPAAMEADLAACRAAIALRLGDLAAVEAMLTASASRDAIGADEARELAIHRKLHRPEEARVLLDLMRRVAPPDPVTLYEHADVLLRLGRFDEADGAIGEALGRFPGDGELLFARAVLAMKTSRWDEAIAGFEDRLRRDPGHSEARDCLARTRMEQAHARLEAGEGEDPAAAEAHLAERQDVGFVEDKAIRRLLLGFESIGQDCELGLVQRRYGAEPLGLFRWNFTTARNLREASDMGFAGMGEPEHTTMSLWADYEYYLSDRRWGFGFHTWLSRHEAERDALFATMCKRVVFLQRKLLRDLASADKIFVHKTFSSAIDDVRPLLVSLRRHGSVRLLWVRSLSLLPNDIGRQPGEVHEIEPGFYAGYVSSFGNRIGAPWNIAFADWIALCRAAVALAGTAQSRAATSGRDDGVGEASSAARR